MSDIVEFLRARLDEDEAIAEAGRARFGPNGASSIIEWEQPHNSNVWRAGTDILVATGEYDEPLDKAIGRHIARHDPARELREVAAKRRILGEHKVYSATNRACIGCGSDRQEDWLIEDVNDCPILRALASVHSDHPDCRPEWAL